MPDGKHGRRFSASPANIVLMVFLGVGGFYLLSEHRAHLIGAGPLIILLGLCIVMHFFMHGSHGGHAGSHHDREEQPGGGATGSRRTEHGAERDAR